MVAADNINSSSTSFTQINNFLSMVGKSTSSLVSLVFFAVLAYKRNATMISFFLGSIANAIAAKLLKRIIRQERPNKNKKDDKGMPSSHSMSLGFIGTFAYLGWGRNNHLLVAPAALAYITMSLYYRVQSKLHTKEQVYVGVVFGALNGYLWYQFTHGFRPFSAIRSLNAIVSSTMLPSSGVLPAQYLILPATVGLAVVGSLERRIPQWIMAQSKKRKKQC